MKYLKMAALLLVLSAGAQAEWVDGYFTRDGRYVPGYYRSDANNTVRDNYTYKGNVNPYTGRPGTNYYRNNPTSQYYQTPPPRTSNPLCPSCGFYTFITGQYYQGRPVYRCSYGHSCY